LRWDFGFTCAFCLLHEADFFHGLPGEGLGLMTIEHRKLKRDEPDLVGAYDNCIYACRWCNLARGTKDLETPEARLLDPALDPWSEHFDPVGDSLQPKPGDHDARYTLETYDLNNESRTCRRQARRELIEDRMKLLARIDGELAILLDLAEKIRHLDFAEFLAAWREILDLREHSQRALRDLEAYRAIPRDAPDDCRCDDDGNLTLPQALDDQCLDIDLLPRSP
jgi:hypothetical protein